MLLRGIISMLGGSDMNSISQGVLDNHQVRFSKKQKANFAKYLADSMPQHQFNIEQGGICGNNNIVVGDIDNAKVIYTAHYDTQPIMLLPMPIVMTPNNWFWFLFWQLVLPIIIMIVPMGLLMRFGLPVLAFAYYVLLICLLIFAPANKHTVNDNTSGVICLVELLSRSDIDTSKVAFVFFDNEEKGLFGSMFFAKKHPHVSKHTPIFNMDCVAVGDTIMVLKNKKLKTNDKLHSAITDSFAVCPHNKKYLVQDWCLYPSDQINFSCGIAVVAVKHSRVIGYYLDRVHSPLDTVLDDDNITYIVDSLAKLASAYTGSNSTI